MKYNLYDRVMQVVVVVLALAVFIIPVWQLLSCQPTAGAKSISVNSICEDALVKVAVVIAAAQFRNIPVQQYVDGMCKVSSIVEPWIKDALKADMGLGASAAPYDPLERSLEAARKEGFIK